MAAKFEEVLRPAVDRMRIDVAAVIEIDRRKRIILGENVTDTVSMAGLHSRQRGGVVRPGAGIVRAGVAMRLRRHERRLLPTVALACVHRHTAHCGRSISGASARGSFARSA